MRSARAKREPPTHDANGIFKIECLRVQCTMHDVQVQNGGAATNDRRCD
jgi:hypothetical protein